MKLASLASVVVGVVLLASSSRPVLAQGSFTETDLVSDIPGRAARTDPNLVNSWGLVPGPTGVFWVSAADRGVSTLYQPDGTPVPLVVTIPGGGNTGVVVTDRNSAAFAIPSGDTTARAVFIFVTENGTIAAWSPTVNMTNAIQVASTAGANYKGVAIAGTTSSPMLYAANFAAGRIDVFDRFFHPVTTSGSFTDPDLPSGYAPFNIAALGGQLYVAYAQLDPATGDEVAGPGKGYVDVFAANGVFVRRLISSGVLNAPWGMVIAPPGFGTVGGRLLVGNFGDGRINAFAPGSGAVIGALRDSASGNPVEIEGLWGLAFGAVASGPAVATRLYFAAGIADEAHGLFGYLAPARTSVVVGCGRGVRTRDDADADFWRDLCRGGGDKHGHRRRDGAAMADSLRALFDCVSSSSRPFGAAGCFTAGCELLTNKSHLSARDKAARAYLALLLDRCAGLACDSTVVRCRADGDNDDSGDRDDDDDARVAVQQTESAQHHDHNPGVTMTLGDVVALIDTSMCSAASTRRTFAALEELAQCAIKAAHDSQSGDGDDDDGGGGKGDRADHRAQLEVTPLDGNPIRLGNGVGTRFSVSLTAPAAVRLGVYDASGRIVAELLRDPAFSGERVVHWDGRDLHGKQVPPGIYFYRGITDRTVAAGRIVVLR